MRNGVRRHPAVKAAALILAGLAALLGAAQTAGAFLLPDTGQVKCYRATAPFPEVACAGTGQDGAYTIHPMSFTDNSDGTVTDANTGLTWQQQGDGAVYTWYQAAGVTEPTSNPAGDDVCGSLVLGGHDDWRLPGVKELTSIVDYRVGGPTIPAHVFLGTQFGGYWTSTPHASDPARVWTVVFGQNMIPGGGFASAAYRAGTGPVRCVRGAPTPSAFVDNRNGTVTDVRAALVWQRGEPVGTKTWGAALAYCRGLVLGGASDWRLPNVKELESLVDERWSSPAIDTTLFPYAENDLYWASTTYGVFDNAYAWGVRFADGAVTQRHKLWRDGGRTRCVRSGAVRSRSLASTGALDGWILESAAGSGARPIRASSSLTSFTVSSTASFLVWSETITDEPCRAADSRLPMEYARPRSSRTRV